jgi:hypothetical protein
MGLGTGGSDISYMDTFKNQKKDDDKGCLEAYNMATKETTEHGFIQGELTAIKFGKGAYKDVEHNTIAFYIKDGLDTYLLKSGFERITTCVRALMNRLLTAESFGDIKISYFGAKGEYKNVGVSANGVKLEYAIDKEARETLTYKMTDKSGKVVSSDYSDLDNVLIDNLKKLVVPRLSGASTISEVVTKVKESEPSTEQTQSTTIEETPKSTGDLPF